MICLAIIPPATDACGKPPNYVVTFSDGDRAPMRLNCMIFYKEFAAAHSASLRIERLPLDGYGRS